MLELWSHEWVFIIAEAITMPKPVGGEGRQDGGREASGGAFLGGLEAGAYRTGRRMTPRVGGCLSYH
jgi:hypothetical protein